MKARTNTICTLYGVDYTAGLEGIIDALERIAEDNGADEEVIENIVQYIRDCANEDEYYGGDDVVSTFFTRWLDLGNGPDWIDYDWDILGDGDQLYAVGFAYTYVC